MNVLILNVPRQWEQITNYQLRLWLDSQLFRLEAYNKHFQILPVFSTKLFPKSLTKPCKVGIIAPVTDTLDKSHVLNERSQSIDT